MRKIYKISVLVLLLCTSYSYAQISDEANRFRLAQMFVQQGDYESAIKLYEQLYAVNPGNISYFDGLRNCYLQVKQYDKAMAMVQERVQKNPSDVNLTALLGDIYYKSGDEANAYAMWDKTVRMDEKNQNIYKIVTNYLIENRLFDKAIELFLKGRKTIGNPDLFVTDLGMVYAITMDFKSATREYVKLLKRDAGQLAYVEMRLSGFAEREEGLKISTEVVKEEAESNEDNISLQYLLAWMYFESKNFEGAYSVHRVVDKIRGSNGMEIFAFAERAFREKAYEVASKAYKEIIDNYPKMPLIPNAKFGYARSAEELANREADPAFDATLILPVSSLQYPATEAVPVYRGAIAIYEDLAQQYSHTEWFAESWYRIGVIKFERFFDLDGALTAFDQVLKQAPQSRISIDATLRAGDVLVEQGKLSDSRQRYQAVLNLPNSSSDYKDRATFKISEIDYLEGKFDDAVSRLSDISKNASADATNDALSLQIFIQDNRNPETALKDFAHGELLVRQKRFSEATAIFENVKGGFPASSLVDESLMKIAELQNRMQQYSASLAAYQELLEKYHDGMWVDKAQMCIAETYQYGLKDKQNALQTYQKLLKDFPNSIYVAEARKRIREIRGDSL
jgi:tetratricopeptide (TPR) repeat protein